MFQFDSLPSFFFIFSGESKGSAGMRWVNKLEEFKVSNRWIRAISLVVQAALHSCSCQKPV